MRRLVVAPRAATDIVAILRTSLDRHGSAAADRYERLLELALQDLLSDPQRPGSRSAEVEDLRLYPLRHPARRLPAAETVRSPPHLIAYRFDTERLEVVRVLHEAMDVPARLVGRD